MHLLYVDESGAVSDPNQKYFILAGVCIFERQTHWVEQALNTVAAKFDIDGHMVELHGSPMRAGRDGWKQHKLEDRLNAIKDSLRTGVADQFKRPKGGVRVFGVAIEKARLNGEDPVEFAFMQLVSRFDLFLKRIYSKHDDAQRGLMLFDKSSTEIRIQKLSSEFKYDGHTWGKVKNLAEVPVFLDSKSSRCIQLADLVAYAIFRKYEHNDPQFFDEIKGCFDSEGGIVHGLYELPQSYQKTT